MADRPLADYYAAVSLAVNADDVQAVHGLIALMAEDGHTVAAEELARMIGLTCSTRPAPRPLPATTT